MTPTLWLTCCLGRKWTGERPEVDMVPPKWDMPEVAPGASASGKFWLDCACSQGWISPRLLQQSWMDPPASIR